MQRILVINPNTTQAVTDMVVASCRAAHPEVQWDGATGRVGASYIASEVAYALAAHATLDAYAAHYKNHDAVLIACFGDPGLLALREVSVVPVTGLAQASFLAATRLGRFAVVTGGKAWGPMLERFARMHQLDANLLGVFTVELTGVQIAKAPDQAVSSLIAACTKGIQAGAEYIVLGGAALAGLAPRLQAQISIPVLDNVLLGAQAVMDAACPDGVASPQAGASCRPSLSPLPVTGVSGPLASLLALNRS